MLICLSLCMCLSADLWDSRDVCVPGGDDGVAQLRDALRYSKGRLGRRARRHTEARRRREEQMLAPMQRRQPHGSIGPDENLDLRDLTTFARLLSVAAVATEHSRFLASPHVTCGCITIAPRSHPPDASLPTNYPIISNNQVDSYSCAALPHCRRRVARLSRRYICMHRHMHVLVHAHVHVTAPMRMARTFVLLLPLKREPASRR
jgi:hypothetical protein